ncbi:MAG: zinc-binding alcohol dehydrogenase [Chloroflexi bacterium]|nr:zinc-binding alcohol dehydrogenase [Chloroflexota bacterium]
MDGQRIVFTAANQAELQPFPVEESLPGDEVLVQTLYTLISPGTEGAWYSAVQRDVAGDRFTYPIYPGYCHVGRVMACGPQTVGVAQGDVVVSGAAHASHVRLGTARGGAFVHADLRQPLGRVPKGVPLPLAPFAKMAEIAITAVRSAEFSLGDKVLVTGLGMVGNLAAQLFQLAGADVMATDLVPFRLERARACGIRRAINPREVDLEAAVRDWSGGHGAHVTVESVGLSELILQAIGLTRRLGQVILLGTPRQKAMLNPTPAFWRAHMNGITIRGALRCLFYPLDDDPYHGHSVASDLEQVLGWIESGQLQVAPLHTHTYQPDQCQAAYQALQQDRDHYLGVVLDWQGFAED